MWVCLFPRAGPWALALENTPPLDLLVPIRSTAALVLIHVGVFLITLSGLVFEVALTRIYSATIWYHFAFVAVSVALLGWGLGGFALHLTKGRWLTPTLDKAAGAGRSCMA